MASFDPVTEENTFHGLGILGSPKEKGLGESVILFQDFDTETTGEIPENWTVTNPHNGSFIVDETVYYGNQGKSGKFTDNSTIGFPSPYRTFPPQGRTIVVSFAIRPSESSGDHTNLIVYVDDGNWHGANIYFTENGIIGYQDDAGLHNLRSYSANEWYKVKIIMNIPEKVYNIHINNHLEAEWAKFNKFTVSHEICRIIFKGVEAWQPIGHIDEIEIRDHINVPEDFPEIQDAIDTAHTGNTIYASSRTYYECIRFQDKSGLKLIGKDRDNVILDGGFNGAGQYVVLIDKTSSNITIQNLTIRNADKDGIYIRGSNNNVTNVRVTSSLRYGIHIESTGNTIKENIIINNEKGVGCTSNAQDNDFYHNKFVYNKLQASDDGTNIWDHGYPDGGNYWSDYEGVDYHSGEKQCCPPNDGIGDTPYTIDIDTIDKYPLFLIKPDTKIIPIEGPIDKIIPSYVANRNGLIDYNEDVMIKAPILCDVPIQEAWLHLNVDGNLEELEMNVKTCELNVVIAGRPYNITVSFYINATNIHGFSIISKSFSYIVLDTVEPEITDVDYQPDINRPPAQGGPIYPFENQKLNVTATVEEHVDASGVEKVTVSYIVNNGTEWLGFMTHIQSGIDASGMNVSVWRATIPAQPANASVSSYVQAFDRAGKTDGVRDGYRVRSLAILYKVDTDTGEEIHSLDFEVMSEGETSVRYFNVTNNGEGDLDWTIQADESWIRVSPTSSDPVERFPPGETRKIKVKVDTTDLSPCPYVGMLNVTWSGESNAKGSQMGYVYVTVRSVLIDRTFTSRSRVDMGSKATVYFHAVWGHNASQSIQEGTITINSTGWNSPKVMPVNSTGWINFTDSHPNVDKYTYQVIAVNCPYTVADKTYEITSFAQLASVENPSVIWDRVNVNLEVNDDRIDVGTSVNITWTAFYEFDGRPFSGSITLNNTQKRYDTAGRRCYTAISISDPVHMLTEFTSNTVCCIWDRIQVIAGGVSLGYVDSVKTATVHFVTVYEYDGELFDGTKGSLWVKNSVNGSGWIEQEMQFNFSAYRWECVYPYGTGDRTFMVSRANDTKYGLTILHDKVGPIPTPPYPENNALIQTSSITVLDSMNLAAILNIIVGAIVTPIVVGLYLRRIKKPPPRTLPFQRNK